MQPAILSSGVLLGIVLLLTHINKAESNPLEEENLIERNPGPQLIKTMPKYTPDGLRRPSREELMNSIDDDGGIRLRNPYLVELLETLEQELMARKEHLANSKRGLDLGLSRGFSGSQAAKHLMGLAAANFAGGPGRKRRSLTYVS